MIEFDWNKPLLVDWGGENGPQFTKKELENCVINKILRNQFFPPNERREFIRQKPWWNPESPRDNLNNPFQYIPGKRQVPLYPQLSALTKQQHQLGLRVLSEEYKVQPLDFPSPSRKDFEFFKRIKQIYEEEQKEYRLWAKKLWVNGDCGRTLSLDPMLENVYEAQFNLKKKEIYTLPHNYTMAAEISLETRRDAFVLHPIEDLKKVNVKCLPEVDFPDELDMPFSVLQSFNVPKPCHLHTCRFILPYEDTVTDFSLPEVYRELANYATDNDTAFIASEKALQCLLDSERDWKLPISVVEVICPESGGLKTVVVLGSEFSVQKESGARRSYEAFRHLLRETIIASTDTTEEPSTSKQPDLFNHSEASQSDNSDNEPLEVDINEQRRRSTESLDVYKGDTEIQGCSSEPNQLLNQPSDVSDDEQLVINDSEQRGRSTKSADVLQNYPTNTNVKSDSQIQSCKSEPNQIGNQSDSSDEEQLVIDDGEQRGRSTESADVSQDFTKNSKRISDAKILSCSSELNQITIHNDNSNNKQLKMGVSKPRWQSTETAKVPQVFHFHGRDTSGIDCTRKEEGEQRGQSTESANVSHNYRKNSNVTSDTEKQSCRSEPNQIAYQSDSSDEEQLVIDDGEQRGQSTENSAVSQDFTKNSKRISDAKILSCSSELNQITIHNDNSNNKQLKMGVSKPRWQSTETAKVPQVFHFPGRDTSGIDCTRKDDGEQRGQSTESANVSQNYPKNINVTSDTEKQSCRSEPNQIAYQSDSSDEEQLVIDDGEQRGQSTENSAVSQDFTKNSKRISDAKILSCSSELNQITIHNDNSNNKQLKMGVSKPRWQSTETAKVPQVFHFHGRDTSGIDCTRKDDGEQRGQSTESANMSHNYPKNSNVKSDTEKQSCRSEPNQIAYQSDSSDEEQLVIDDGEQRGQSTENSAVSQDFTKNSKRISDAKILSCSSELNQITIHNDNSNNKQLKMGVSKPRWQSTETAKVPQVFHFHGRDTSGIDCTRKDDGEQRGQSTESANVSQNYPKNINVTSDTEKQSCRSEPNQIAYQSDSSDEEQLVIDDGEQRGQSTENSAVSQDFTKNSKRISDAKILSCSSELNQITIHTDNSNNEKLKMGVSKPRWQSTETAKVPQVFHFHARDTSGIDCTCEGTAFELPPPRSFKKWQVMNTASKRSFDLIIHSSHKVRQGKREVIMEPIVEWQPELGACMQSEGRLRALALSLMMRPKAKLVNVRVDHEKGEVIVIEELTEMKFMRRYGDKRGEIADTIYTAIDQLRFLKTGQYILAHNSCHGPNAMIYSAQAAALGAGSAAHTISLRPKEEDTLSEEASFAKIPPELCVALLPYHKLQGILPLAFTPNKKHVKINKPKAGPATNRGPQPPSQADNSDVSERRRQRRQRHMKLRRQRQRRRPANAASTAAPTTGEIPEENIEEEGATSRE